MANSTAAAVTLQHPRRTERPGPRTAVLRPREADVLRQIAWGYTNREIASRLNLSVKTIENHKANAMRKLGITRRSEIVRYALQQHWFDFDLAVTP